MTPTALTGWLSSAAAQRDSGLARTSLEALQRAGIIGQKGSKVHSDDLTLLKKWKETEYITGKDNIDLDGPIGFAVPLTNPDLSPDLELTASNSAEDAREAVQEQGISLSSEQFLAGWWSCHMDRVEHLVETRAPLVGVTGGFVTSGAWIDGLALAHPRNLRKAFIVTRMTDEEIKNYRGFVPRVNQSGTYFLLQ